MLDNEAEFVVELRVLMLMSAAEQALMTPIEVSSLHMLAYMANVLSPVWGVPLFDGKLLKRGSGPFYPTIQAAADRLVGRGMLELSGLDYATDEDGKWRLLGSYQLNREPAGAVLAVLERFSDEALKTSFFLEVAFCLSAIDDAELSKLVEEDATYGDPIVDLGNVVDFGEWKDNFSANVAETIGDLLHSKELTTPGEKLHSYIRFIGRRLHAAS